MTKEKKFIAYVKCDIELTDFMPWSAKRENSRSSHRSILRRIVGKSGAVEVQVSFKPRFHYGSVVPNLRAAKDGIVASANGENAFLQSSIPLQATDGEVRGSALVEAGESLWIVLQYDHEVRLEPRQADQLLKETRDSWVQWVHQCDLQECVFEGPWHDLVVRSGLVLKLLTHPETGAIAAAPTTSLPEEIGGVRNWDYRYAWIRDASFTVQALYNLGHAQEASQYFGWLRSLCEQCKEPAILKIMYSLHGEADLEERELEYLSGYRNSAPVRIGNKASDQRQLDIYGELILAAYETSRYGQNMAQQDWIFLKRIINHVAEVWNQKDSGIWEVRSGEQHFTYSKLMCWVALDRGIRIAEQKKLDAPLRTWTEIREKVRDAILENGFNKDLNSFVQSFGSSVLDATSLLIPKMEFLPFDDPRVGGTIQATLKDLSSEGLVYRYKGEDGVEGGEGTFVLCTFWLIDALTLTGDLARAEELLKNVVSYASPLGLLAEEIDPTNKILLGNYPQAFSHIGLINSALYLGLAKGKKQMGPNPVGA